MLQATSQKRFGMYLHIYIMLINLRLLIENRMLCLTIRLFLTIFFIVRRRYYQLVYNLNDLEIKESDTFLF
jgi:hypothetical protein